MGAAFQEPLIGRQTTGRRAVSAPDICAPFPGAVHLGAIGARLGDRILFPLGLFHARSSGKKPRRFFPRQFFHHRFLFFEL